MSRISKERMEKVLQQLDSISQDDSPTAMSRGHLSFDRTQQWDGAGSLKCHCSSFPALGGNGAQENLEDSEGGAKFSLVLE